MDAGNSGVRWIPVPSREAALLRGRLMPVHCKVRGLYKSGCAAVMQPFANLLWTRLDFRLVLEVIDIWLNYCFTNNFIKSTRSFRIQSSNNACQTLRSDTVTRRGDAAVCCITLSTCCLPGRWCSTCRTTRRCVTSLGSWSSGAAWTESRGRATMTSSRHVTLRRRAPTTTSTSSTPPQTSCPPVS